MSEALCQECLQMIVPGDLRLELPLRIDFALILLVKKDYAKAEQMMRENLQLSYHYRNQRQIAYVTGYLGQIALVTHQDPVAEEYFQKQVDLLREFGESAELATCLIYLGRSLAAQKELEAARDQYRRAMRIGQALDMPLLVHWGLVWFARTYIEEGQMEKALEIAFALRGCSIEYALMQAQATCLLTDLQAALPEGQVEAVRQRVAGKSSPDQAVADVLAYVLEREAE